MNKSVTLKHSLLVQKPMETLSSPQKCKIPRIADLPAASLIIVKSGSRKFICRLYFLAEVYDDKRIAFVDDSVEIHPVDGLSEITWIQEIELVTAALVEFKEIQVKLQLNVNELNTELIKSTRDLQKLVHSIVKNYKFSTDCAISCNRRGISRIHVIATDVDGYGTVDEHCRIVIEGISVEASFTGRNALGGLRRAEEALENVIERNVSYMRNAGNFTYKPNCQALLAGPIGSGKTSLIHQVASKLKCILFELSGDVFQPLPGETEQAIEQVFNKIKALSKIIGRSQLIMLLIENVEVFCPTFNQKMKENSHSSRISYLIFALLDEVSASEVPMVVIGTTSKLESVNSALRRSSRLGSCEIFLDMPDEQQRYEIIEILSRELSFGKISEEILMFVSQGTPGFVGADLEVLFQFASRQLQNECLEFTELNLQKAFEAGLRSITPSVMRENLGLVTKSTLKLDSIGGMEALKKTLITSVLGPLRHPEKYQKLGLRCSNGILLYGPSGCAKTTIVKCLAGEAKMTLISVSSAEIYSPYVGEAEKYIVKLFNQARMNSPTILFFDEIDTIVGNRSVSGGSNDAHKRILSTLLTEIDGFGSNDKKTVLIIGATNKPDMIDDALMRPGRFDKLIHVPAPDLASRISILQFIARDMPIANDVKISSLAEQTHNFSGADLVNLCNEAAMNTATKDLLSDVITIDDFNDVLTYLGPSLSEKQIEFYKDYENARRRQT